jgi:hypothetical protein
MSYSRPQVNIASQDRCEAMFIMEQPCYLVFEIPLTSYRAPTFQVIEAPGVIEEPVTLQTDQLKVFAVT